MCKELSSYQRVMLALEGKQPDRVPIMLYPSACAAWRKGSIKIGSITLRLRIGDNVS